VVVGRAKLACPLWWLDGTAVPLTPSLGWKSGRESPCFDEMAEQLLLVK